MKNYLKKNFVSFLIGCVIGLPVSIYAVNHQEPATIPVYYDPGLFEQFSVESEQPEPTEPGEIIETCEMTAEELEEELFYDSLELLEKCDAVIVGQRYGISEGMATEIEKAKQLNIPVFYRDQNIADFKNLTIVCDKSSGYAKTRIIQDNVELQRVTSFSFTHKAGENPVLNVDMVEPEKEGETDGG